MSQKYLRELIDFAQREIPTLQYDFQQASTLYSLQSACQRQFNILTHMLHHIIYAAYENGVAPTAPPTPVAQVLAPVVAPPPPAHITAPMIAPALPPPSAIPQPALSPAADLAGTPNVDVQPGVTNVIITPHGTRVVAPTGAATVLPPGEHVDIAAATGIPVPPDAPPGVTQVVLPPGGSIGLETLAALSNRS